MIDDTAARLCELPGIVAVNIVNLADATLSITAIRPAPFADIERLTADIDHVEVIVARPVKPDPTRYRSEPGMAGFYFDRSGKRLNPGEAKAFAEHLGIARLPILNALAGNRLGILFASAADAERFDGICAGRVLPALAELPGPPM